ncbi:aminotransferase class III-fold pyridoxal phosphate-dependent enzyme [Sphingomonas naphthae]|uniref:Aminotransferase class III-fold pyridoxal phosphate-dependent enzyme n=1 Tax=Sphingomonas naphthae TaxID=1813468 RepID=A0ABY7TGT0_9SPHN|nr:aminotransferase class III-fold pyridoxal phosphate-dependent enzyme [Sphingomonas naphthae]WCT72268.1 aminotransferase class III-fold pyridoxal phosphate-dependent enzyme [Sphingomonas naphthae]
MTSALALLAAAAAVGTAGLAAPKAHRRLLLSKSKHKSLGGHVRMAKRFAGLVPFIDYGEARFFTADMAPEEVADRRRAGFERLSLLFATRYPKSRALTARTREGLSDLQFTGSYRVPFQFSRIVRERLGVGAFVESSAGVTVTDLDGNVFYDLTGSYGVNLLGYDAYKAIIAEAGEKVGALGPVLGSYHPIVADNVARLRALSGLDEVSFHMSGTEAVMQAVRLARYHTGRTHLVRFCGAYHGWWGDVQPGIGNPIPADHTYTLADMSEATLRTLASRKNIACVLINPLQALHINSAAPSDNLLVDGSRRAGVDRAAYAEWLAQLAEVCRAKGIVLILDDVFTGFRIAKGGAAEYFGIRPDLVTYGKSLGGGLPVGVLCGEAALMKRFRPDRPADICFARGTFNAHPYVMAAMNGFLRELEKPATAALYQGMDERWAGRAESLNARLAGEGLPVRVASHTTIWTVLYDVPSRYNWMLQYYLRAHGLALSWVGSGRIIFSLNYSDADFAEVADRFVSAAKEMAADGWWWTPEGASNKAIRRGILKEMIAKRLGRLG